MQETVRIEAHKIAPTMIHLIKNETQPHRSVAVPYFLNAFPWSKKAVLFYKQFKQIFAQKQNNESTENGSGCR